MTIKIEIGWFLYKINY